MADGRALALGPGVHALADGSRIEASADGAITARVNDGRALRLSLERGRARFDVQPGGPRRWTIDAGICEVEVVGTSFVVDRRGDGRVRVEVDHGRVRVRGEGVAGGEAILGAGDVLEVRPIEAPAIEAPAIEVQREAPERGEPSIESEIDGDALLARADAARADGRPWDAASALRRFVRERQDDPRAAIIAFTLARVELDELDHPRAAARACELALRLGLPGDVRELARARRVEAWARAGDRDAAARAARDYLARHPEGAWAERVRMWSE
jgi:transmembrane sensor